MKIVSLLFLSLLAIFPVSARANAVREETIGKILRSEIKKAMRMKEPGYPSPYYIGLTATNGEYRQYTCSMGRLVYKDEQRSSYINDDIRIGSRTFDNYPIDTPDVLDNFLGHYVNLNDNFALRYGLWRLLDDDYKNAAGGFLRKQAPRAVRGKMDYDTADFSQEYPRIHVAQEPADDWTQRELIAACRQASAPFRKNSGLLEASSGLTEYRSWSRLRDSEGSRVDFGSRYAEITLAASAVAADGFQVSAGRDFIAVSSSDFPSPQALRDAAESVLSDISLLKAAKIISPLDGPAVLDPSVSAAVILALGERLSGENQRDPAGTQIFKGKVGAKILPSDLTLEDNPLMASYEGISLAGHYDYDNQGMPAQNLILIKNGILKNFLLSRHPVIGFSHSNGHGRSPSGFWVRGFPGVLALKSAKPRGRKEILFDLRKECLKRNKPYGIYATKFMSFTENDKTSSQGSLRLICGLIYLVNAKTGKMTLVRNIDLVGTPLSLMNSILAAGKDESVQNVTDDGIPVSVISPSLLLSNIETQHSNESPHKPPILNPPPAPLDAFSNNLLVPTIPQIPYIEVRRYLINNSSVRISPFTAPGVGRLFISHSSSNTIAAVEISGNTLQGLAKNTRKADSIILKVSKGSSVKKSWLCTPLPVAAYRARYRGAWPIPSR
ncbi:MAG: metallopeptidase TldD-related protein [Elusimicrobiota bacterium]